MALALKTYFQKIADPSDIAPTAAVAFTINHIAAVFLPAALGYLCWSRPGRRLALPRRWPLCPLGLRCYVPVARHPATKPCSAVIGLPPPRPSEPSGTSRHDILSLWVSHKRERAPDVPVCTQEDGNGLEDGCFARAVRGDPNRTDPPCLGGPFRMRYQRAWKRPCSVWAASGAERMFWKLDGVWLTMGGYAGGHTPNPTMTKSARPRPAITRWSA